MTPNLPQIPRTEYRRGPHWVALLAVVFTWPLLLVGGSVTTYRVGMAVPDWPTTFGINMFLYDFWNAPFGVKVEHTHRLYGAAVGLATIVLCGWFLAADRRRWMKGLGVLALLAVIGQGVLGGYRVRHNSTALAAVHGVTGQAFFALMVSLCVLTGRDWMAAAQPRPDPARLKRRSTATLVMVVAQIVVGAWLRHFGSNLALAVHALVAIAVWSHAGLLAWQVERHRREVSELVPAAWMLALAVTIQVALGVAAWWVLPTPDRPVTFWPALIRTGHQANAALVLASVVILTLRSARHLARRPDPARVSSPELELEAVA